MQIVVPHEDNFLRRSIERLSRFAVHDHCKWLLERKQLSERILNDENARLSSWEAICPAEFQKELDPSRKAYHADRLRRVMSWNFGEKGLLLRGPSERCKTRFMYALLAREYASGRSIGAYLHSDLRRIISSLASANSSELARFAIKLVKLDILFVDDLGKGKPTPTSDETFFSLIDGRNRDCRPTMFTLNGTLQIVMQNVVEEYREPLISRISTKTQEITFA